MASQPFSTSPSPAPRRRLITGGRVMAAVLVVSSLLVIAPTMFVVARCYGDAFQAPMRRPEAARDIPNYVRAEAHTYLALPERVVLYTANEYAQSLAVEQSGGFPHFGAILQYWRQYDRVCAVTSTSYSFETGEHAMLAALGTTFSIEQALKGFYEGTVGWLTERLQSKDTAEDAFAARTAAEYAAFMHIGPGHDFPFGERLATLWTDVPLWGPHPIRKWERRLALTAEYGLKTVQGALVSLADSPAYAAGNSEIHAWIERVPESVFDDRRITRVATVAPGAYIVRLPRADAFTRAVLDLHARGVEFRSIGGNDDILLTALAPSTTQLPATPGRVVSVTPVLTDPSRSRTALGVPVASLHEVITTLQSGGAAIEHVYDY